MIDRQTGTFPEEGSVMKEVLEWHHDTTGAKVAQALRKNDFQSSYCRDRKEAVKEILEQIPDGAVVGADGSWRVAEPGLLEGLITRGV